jgi:hypothetical protein
LTKQRHYVKDRHQKKAEGQKLSGYLWFFVQREANGNTKENGNQDIVGKELKDKNVITVKIYHISVFIFSLQGIFKKK